MLHVCIFNNILLLCGAHENAQSFSQCQSSLVLQRSVLLTTIEETPRKVKCLPQCYLFSKRQPELNATTPLT